MLLPPAPEQCRVKVVQPTTARELQLSTAVQACMQQSGSNTDKPCCFLLGCASQAMPAALVVHRHLVCRLPLAELALHRKTVNSLDHTSPHNLYDVPGLIINRRSQAGKGDVTSPWQVLAWQNVTQSLSLVAKQQMRFVMMLQSYLVVLAQLPALQYSSRRCPHRCARVWVWVE